MSLSAIHGATSSAVREPSRTAEEGTTHETVTASAAAAATTPRRGVSFRAVLIGLVCATVLCFATPYNDYKVGSTPMGGNQFPFGPIFVLSFLAIVVNIPLRRVAPRWAFSRAELLTIWTLILVTAGLPSSGMMRTFVPNIAAPLYFSNGVNQWESKVWGTLPAWLRLRDKAAADAFFVGYPRGQEHVPWQPWVEPMLAWGAFAACFLVASFCVAAVLRRQWVENEKFAFPLVQLPLLLAEEPEPGHIAPPLLRSPLLWVAVVLVTVVHTLRGMHRLYPSIPDLPLEQNLGELLISPPWNAVGSLPMNLYPMVVGLSYLLSAEVCLSLWFFFLLYKGQLILCGLYNWDRPGPLGGHGGTLFAALESFGGAVALTGWTLWTARRHLREVWEKATNGPRAAEIDDAREMISYRGAAFGLIAAYAGMALWLGAAHVPMLLIGLCLLMVTLALVVIAWAVSQAGLLFMAMPYATIDILGPTIGTAGFKIPALYTVFRAEGPFIYNTRDMLIPALMNGAKAADAAPFDARALFKAMAGSVALGVIVSATASLWLPYCNGGGNSLANSWTYSTGPQIPLKTFGNAATVPYIGAPINLLHIVGGFVAVLGLLFLRARFGFGLHPIGILSASVYAMHMLWFSLLVGWVMKSLIQRYGGMALYRSLLPFFLGLIIGDALNGAVWILLGYATGTGYSIAPG